MPNKYPQDIDQSYLEQFLLTASENPQALVLSAYLEEKEGWEKKLDILVARKDKVLHREIEIEKIVSKKRYILGEVKNELYNKSRIWIEILKLVGIKTEVEIKFNEMCEEINELILELKTLNGEFNNILSEYDKIVSNPPDSKQYELAMMGNTLFKPR